MNTSEIAKKEVKKLNPKHYYRLRVETPATWFDPKDGKTKNKWQSWDAKKSGELGKKRLMNLIPDRLGIVWLRALLYDYRSNTLLRAWHYLDGEMSPNEYEVWEKERSKKKLKKSLLKMTVYHKPAFEQHLIKEGQPNKVTVYSIDVDNENGYIGYDMAIKSLRSWLLGYQHSGDVRQAIIWTIENKQFKNMRIGDFTGQNFRLGTGNQIVINILQNSAYNLAELGVF